MVALSNFAESALLNHICGKTAYTMPTEIYLTLHTADPGETGVLTAEVPASRGYARLAMKASIGTSSAGSAITNSAAFTFGPCVTTAWGAVTHAAITDSATIGAGNVLWKAALTASKTVAVGDTLVIPIGSLSVNIE